MSARLWWNFPAVLGMLLALLVLKFAVVAAASRAFGATPGTAMRSGLWLCAGGVRLRADFSHRRAESAAACRHAGNGGVAGAVDAARPLIVQVSDKLVMRFVASGGCSVRWS